MWGCCFKKIKIVGFMCLNVGGVIEKRSDLFSGFVLFECQMVGLNEIMSQSIFYSGCFVVMRMLRSPF